MSAAGIRAGRAFVELASEDTTLTSGLKKAQRTMDAFAKGSAIAGATLVGAGLAVVGGLAGLANMASDVGSALKDASDRTGIAVESLSALEYAARMSDTSLDALVGNVFKLQKTLAGVTVKKNPFAEFGLDAEKLKAMKPEDAFIAVADALSKIANPTERNAAAMKLFGRGASEIVPLLAAGTDGITGMMEEAKRLGLVMSSTDAGNLEEFGDTVETIGMQVKRVFVTLGTAAATAVLPYTKYVTSALAAVNRFVSEHRGLAVTAGLAAASIVAGGVALIGLAAASTVASAALNGVTLAMKLLAAGGAARAAIGGTVKMLLGVGPALLAVGSGLLSIAPVAAIIVAGLVPIGIVLAEATNNFEFFRVAGSSAIGYVASAFKAGKQLVIDTVGGIMDALATGDFALAGQIAMAGLQVAFQAGKVEVLKVWSAITTTMLTMWAKATSQVMTLWNSLVGAIAGATVTLFMDDDQFQERANKIRDGAAKLLQMAKEAETAGDPDRAAHHREAAAQLMRSAKQEDPEAAKAAAAMMAQDMTSDAQAKIDQALRDRLAEIERNEGTGVADAQKKLDEATAKLAELRAKAAQQRGDADKPGELPPPPTQDYGRTPPPPEVDLKAFAPRVIGGFSTSQIAAQTSVLGLADPLKSLVNKADKTNELLGDIADNTDEDDLYE